MNSFWSGLSSFSPISMVIFKGKVMEDVFYLLGLQAFCESRSKSAGCAKNWHILRTRSLVETAREVPGVGWRSVMKVGDCRF